MNMKGKVYLIDDEQKVTDSLRWLIESVGYEVEAYSEANSFLKKFSHDVPSCLIVDVRMPEMSGLQLQEYLNEQGVIIPIIFLTGHGDIPMAVNTIKKGASEFLTKPVNNQLLLECINKAIQKDEVKRGKTEKKQEILDRVKCLTPREHEVMILMAQGMSTKHIAIELDISPNTVELHRAKVIKKLGVRKHAELVGILLKYDVVTLE